jgi:hypothetical protein
VASRGLESFLALEIPKAGRAPKIDRCLRDLIRRMSKENQQWGASRIHGELLMLGFEVAQSTVSKYMVRGGTPPSLALRRQLIILRRKVRGRVHPSNGDLCVPKTSSVLIA